MNTAPMMIGYLKAMNERSASDLYLTVGSAPKLRIENEMVPIHDNLLEVSDIEEIIRTILTERQQRDFEEHMELNASLDMAKYGRFRINAFRQRQYPALVVRRIISDIPSFQELRLPTILERLSLANRGLILITGMTGAGKTTTLAAMGNYRNENTQGHIITIEDPIEYYHDHKGCVMSQREVGVDTESYAVAVKNALRQRPDVILVGEARDREVMEHALASAETGHLCISTVHASNSYQAIERIVNMFPEDYAQQVRLNVSVNLRAIISQRLVPSVEGELVPVVEILLNQGLIRELIMMGEIAKIGEVMEKNLASGMCTFDQSLLRLLEQGYITEEVALTNADKPSDMKVRIQNNSLTDISAHSPTGAQKITLHD